jgi:hypothetical protein
VELIRVPVFLVPKIEHVTQRPHGFLIRDR